jgi:glycine/D-amino acid oxidase-like deaminating enzyme
MKAVVVGAGIVGTAVAYRLARAGVKTTVLDAGSVGGGTSATTFAWLNSNQKEPLEYHRLNAAGVGEHLALAGELGGASWLHIDGNFEWVPGGDGLERLTSKVERLRGRGYLAELRSTAELRDLEPGLCPPPDVEAVAHYPLEGYADVLPLLGALVDRAGHAGVTVRTGRRVSALAYSGSRVTGVLAGSERVDADVVVCCAGRWTTELLASTGLQLPMQPTAGLICVTSPRRVQLRAVLHSPEVNLRPAGAGRVMLHADDVDANLEHDGEALRCLGEELLERAAAVLPALAGAALESAQVGIRSLPADGLPVVGGVDGLDSLYLVCTHSGVTLGPLLGRLVARELTMGEVDVRLAPFRPERLLTKQSTGVGR